MLIVLFGSTTTRAKTSRNHIISIHTQEKKKKTQHHKLLPTGTICHAKKLAWVGCQRRKPANRPVHWKVFGYVFMWALRKLFDADNYHNNSVYSLNMHMRIFGFACATYNVLQPTDNTVRRVVAPEKSYNVCTMFVCRMMEEKTVGRNAKVCWQTYTQQKKRSKKEEEERITDLSLNIGTSKTLTQQTLGDNAKTFRTFRRLRRSHHVIGAMQGAIYVRSSIFMYVLVCILCDV